MGLGTGNLGLGTGNQDWELGLETGNLGLGTGNLVGLGHFGNPSHEVHKALPYKLALF